MLVARNGVVWTVRRRSFSVIGPGGETGLATKKKQLYGSCREFDTQLQRWLGLQERSGMVTMDDYKDFCATLLAPSNEMLVESVPRALVHCFARGCVENNKRVDAEVYEWMYGSVRA